MEILNTRNNDRNDIIIKEAKKHVVYIAASGVIYYKPIITICTWKQICSHVITI